MSVLAIGTAFLSMDEGCWEVKETLAPAPDYRSVRRWQTIGVWREGIKTNGEGGIAYFQRDLGPAENFTADEFCIVTGVADPKTKRVYLEHTVGEAVDMAEHLRSDQYVPPEKPKPHDLVKLYRELPERRHIDQVKRSTFSGLVKVQRD